MGKKRKQAKVVLKRQKTTKFSCPKCYALSSVTIHIKKDQNGQGKIAECYCDNCQAQYNVRKLRTFENEFNVISNWTAYEQKLREQNIYCPYCQTPVTLDQVSRDAAQMQCYRQISRTETFKKVLEDWKLFNDEERKRMLHKIGVVNEEGIQKQKPKKTKQSTKSQRKKKEMSEDDYSQDDESEQISQQQEFTDDSYNDDDAKNDKKEFDIQIQQETIQKKIFDGKANQDEIDAFGDIQDQQEDLEDDI